jgi:hypothetical protein
MNQIKVFKTIGLETNLFPLKADRDWMKDNKASYNCFPVTLSNKLGYAISFDQDIAFEWDGNVSKDSGIKIFDGKDYCYLGRGGGVISFPTNLIFKTSEDTSLLIMPVPNQFIDGVQCFTSILSSSFYTGALNVVWKITSKNKKIHIPAGTPLASIIPISLSKIQDTSLLIMKSEPEIIHNEEYIDSMFKYGKINNKHTDWYKNATDHLGNKIGKHEVSTLKLKVEREI